MADTTAQLVQTTLSIAVNSTKAAAATMQLGQITDIQSPSLIRYLYNAVASVL